MLRSISVGAGSNAGECAAGESWEARWEDTSADGGGCGGGGGEAALVWELKSAGGGVIATAELTAKSMVTVDGTGSYDGLPKRCQRQKVSQAKAVLWGAKKFEFFKQSAAGMTTSG